MQTIQEHYQLQLRQFLKSYRNKEDCTAEETADRLGVEIATYRNLEGIKPNNRVISALDYLTKIAALSELSLSQFMDLLHRNTRTKSGSSSMKRDLYKWEQDLLQVFDFIGISLRNDLIAAIKSLAKEDWREVVRHIVNLLKLDPEDRHIFMKMTQKLARSEEADGKSIINSKKQRAQKK